MVTEWLGVRAVAAEASRYSRPSPTALQPQPPVAGKKLSIAKLPRKLHHAITSEWGIWLVIGYRHKLSLVIIIIHRLITYRHLQAYKNKLNKLSRQELRLSLASSTQAWLKPFAQDSTCGRNAWYPIFMFHSQLILTLWMFLVGHCLLFFVITPYHQPVV